MKPIFILPLAGLVGTVSALPYVSDWSGNTWEGRPGASGENQYVHGCAMQLYVAPDGDIFQGSTSGGDHGPACMYPADASYVRDLVDSGSTGDTYKTYLQGVTANSNHYFVSVRVNYKGFKAGKLNVNGLPEIPPSSASQWYAVARYNRADMTPAPFQAGYGTHGNLVVLLEIPSTMGDREPFLTGLAADDSYLYVADSFSDEIVRYGAANPSTSIAWTFTKGSDLAVGGTGEVFALSEGFGGTLTRFSPGGQVIASRVFSATQKPTAIAVDRRGTTDKVLVAMDHSASHQIVRHGADLAPDGWTLGVAGGLLPGQSPVANAFKYIKGVGIDANGAVSVLEYGPDGLGTPDNMRNITRLQKFSSGGQLLWKREAHGWIDSPGFSTLNEGVMYSTNGRYVLDLATMDGGGDSWRWDGHTLDAVKYPHDPRLHLAQFGADAVVMGGVEFLTTFSGPQRGLAVYRLEGGVAVPTAIICPNSGGFAYAPGKPTKAWIWSDTNLNGQIDPASEYSAATWKASASEEFNKTFLDKQGGFWGINNSKVYHVPFAGLNQGRTPTWDFAATVITDLTNLPGQPSPLQKAVEGIYDPATDRMYLGVYTERSPARAGGEAGYQEIWCYAGWLSGSPVLVWDRILSSPWGANTGPHDLEFAGEYVFVGDSASQDSGSPTDEQQVRVYSAANGSYVETFLPPADDAHVDYDRARAIRPHRYSNGSYIVGTESFRTQKTQLFYVPAPSSTFRIQRANSQLELGVAGELQNNANIIVESASSAPDQAWEIVEVSGGFSYLKSSHSGQYLNISGALSVPQANIAQWPNPGGDNYLVQFVNPETTAEGIYYNIRVKQGTNAYISTSGNTSGSNVQISSDPSNEKSKWRIEPLGGSRVALVRKGNGRRMALASDLQNGGNIVAEGFSADVDHLWVKEAVEGEWFRLRNKLSGQYLNAASQGANAGNNVAQWPDGTGYHYQLRLVPGSDGSRLEFRHAPGMVLGTASNSSGTNVQLDTAFTGEKTGWFLIPQ